MQRLYRTTCKARATGGAYDKGGRPNHPEMDGDLHVPSLLITVQMVELQPSVDGASPMFNISTIYLLGMVRFDFLSTPGSLYTYADTFKRYTTDVYIYPHP